MLLKRLRTCLLMTFIGILAFTALPQKNISATALAQEDADTITIGMTDMATVLDPAMANDFMTWEVLSHLYVGLTRQIAGTTEYELVLATSHDISDDGLTHTFTIREDASFNNGTLITAETFEYSIRRVLSLDFAGASIMKDVGLTVSVNEDGQLVMTTSRPIPYFEALISLPPFFAVDANDFGIVEPNRFPVSLNSNGIYNLDSWDVGDFIHLKANPNYRYGDAPRTENIMLRQYESSILLQEAILSHEIDMAWRALLLLPDLDEATEANAELQVVNVPSTRIWYLVLNRQFDFVDDPVVRDSIFLMLNRERIVGEDFGGYLTPAYSLVPTFMEDAYNPLWNVQQDIDTAIQNLRDAGYRESRLNQANVNITTSLPGYGNLYAGSLVSVIRDTRQVRVLTLTSTTNLELGTFIDLLQDGDAAGAMFAFTPVVPDPDAYLYPLLHSDGILAEQNNYDLSAVDNLLAQAASEADASTRGELYRRAQDTVNEMDAIAPLWTDSLTVLAWNDIDGIAIEPNFFLHYDQLGHQ